MFPAFGQASTCRFCSQSSRPFAERAQKGKLSNIAVEFLKREDAPTAVEYAVIGAITSLGWNANATFTSVGTAISTSSSS